MGNCLHPSKSERTITISGSPHIQSKSNGHVPKSSDTGDGADHYPSYQRQMSDIDWESIKEETRMQLERFVDLNLEMDLFSYYILLRNINDDILRNPEQLLVNFLLMSVQFLENYEKYVMTKVQH